jgi:plastocyanin
MKSKASRILAVVAIAVIGAVSTGAWGDTARLTSSHSVTLKNIRFHPSTLSIHRGDSVTWLWRDSGTEHNVTGHSFRSRTQTRGSFTVRFAHAGSFSYHCTIHGHEGMKGKIIVH